MPSKREIARQILTKINGAEFARAIEDGANSGEFGAAIGALALDYAFADVWARPGLDLKQKSIAVIASLITQAQPEELKNHIRIGLNNGLSVKEIEEIIIQVTPYVGFPATATAMTATLEVLRERGLDTTSKTAQERGTL